MTAWMYVGVAAAGCALLAVVLWLGRRPGIDLSALTVDDDVSGGGAR